MFFNMVAWEWRTLLWGILLLNLGVTSIYLGWYFRKQIPEHSLPVPFMLGAFMLVPGLIMTVAMLIYRASLVLESL